MSYMWQHGEGGTRICTCSGTLRSQFDNRVSEEEIGDGFDRWVHRRSKKMAISVMRMAYAESVEGKKETPIRNVDRTLPGSLSLPVANLLLVTGSMQHREGRDWRFETCYCVNEANGQQGAQPNKDKGCTAQRYLWRPPFALPFAYCNRSLEVRSLTGLTHRTALFNVPTSFTSLFNVQISFNALFKVPTSFTALSIVPTSFTALFNVPTPFTSLFSFSVPTSFTALFNVPTSSSALFNVPTSSTALFNVPT
jgi:hypothetical protein